MRLLLLMSAASFLGGSTYAFCPMRVPHRAAVAPGGIRRMMTAMETKSEAGPSGVQSLSKWDPSAQQAFIQPAIHNKNPVRVAAILTAAGLASKGAMLVPGNLAKMVHMVALNAWMGSTLWTTFFAGITMMRNLPRQTFGKLQSKLFPLYFQFNFVSILAIYIIRGCPLRTRAGVTLLVSLFSTLLNLVLLEPKSTSIMLERYKLEDDKKKDSDEYKELGKTFGKFHGMSSFANLGALIGSFVYAWELASVIPI
ncbi:conserved unknown protein [Ectocarpus siliculosus]|uniref:TMEM205-like domain-containing protein n=1 Tax=Ectocarpus siliculosus TaxID=2880 RepID=D8LRR6_ECTSI|nr:conserved unknown protein [Ectocarpus siliculosus]|eukprot:CBN73833.1 conserved unknown protein [Ectocarpus siliculosus]